MHRERAWKTKPAPAGATVTACTTTDVAGGDGGVGEVGDGGVGEVGVGLFVFWLRHAESPPWVCAMRRVRHAERRRQQRVRIRWS